MADEELQKRLEALREDFVKEQGRPFAHFYCPILGTDESGTLCKGHVVPKALGVCNAWVPQRADVDNFFGSVAEADYVAVVQDRGKNAFEVWLNPKLRRRHRPRIEYDGKPLGHYFPKNVKPVPGQTPVQLVGNDGVRICNMVVAMSPEEMTMLSGKKIQLVIERDYRSAVIASLLKAAHLTLFRMLGYKHVFSPTGIYLAHILRDFFVPNRHLRGKELEAAMEAYFRPFACMISPMIVTDASCLQGTVTDNLFLACMATSQGIFSLGVVVKAGNDTFCIFLPTDDGQTIDTYFSFLKEPPQSIAVRLVRFCQANQEHESRWEIANGDPLRIPLPHTLAESQTGNVT